MAGRIAPQSLISPAVRARDRTCRISSHETGTDVAHLCPVHEQAWFTSNEMITWNTDLTLEEKHQMHDTGNLLLLRADLHLAFDECKFCFFPKGDSKYVVHMLASTPDIGTLYHNSSLHSIDECSPEMLYTRFAWAIFPNLNPFFRSRTTRLVSVVETGENGRKQIVKKCSTTELAPLSSASRRSNQKKRQRNHEPENFESDQTHHLGSTAGRGSEVGDRMSIDSSCTEKTPERSICDQQKNETSSQIKISLHNSPTTPADDTPHKDHEIHLLKEAALSRQRPSGFTPKRTGQWQPEFEKNPKMMYEAYDYKIVDDLSDPDDWVGKDKV